MSEHSEAFVGVDTSKLRNAVAIAEGGRDGEVRFFGEIDNTVEATAKLVRKLAGKYERLTFCYEAGPTGYGLYRQITGLGQACSVVAPSLIPKKPGDRVKTNRRDAMSLAKILRAGDLVIRFRREAPAGFGVPAAARPAFPGAAQDVDQGAYELAGGAEVRVSAAASGFRGDDAGDTAGPGAPDAPGGGDAWSRAGGVAGCRGGGLGGDARPGSDLRGDIDG